MTTIKPPPAMEPAGLKWRRKNTDSHGVYFEDPRKFGINMDHPEYEWSGIFTAAQLAERDAQWTALVTPLAEALRNVLDTHEAEAKAYLTAQVASENFSKRSAKADETAHFAAMMASSKAEKAGREVLAAIAGGQP